MQECKKLDYDSKINIVSALMQVDLVANKRDFSWPRIERTATQMVPVRYIWYWVVLTLFPFSRVNAKLAHKQLISTMLDAPCNYLIKHHSQQPYHRSKRLAVALVQYLLDCAKTILCIGCMLRSPSVCMCVRKYVHVYTSTCHRRENL